jgi:hypothetical protein
MSDEIRIYKQPCLKYYTVKNGEIHSSPNTRVIKYKCKLHHPDATELDKIREELAAGKTKKELAAKYNIGCYQRLTALLKRFPPQAAEDDNSLKYDIELEI